MTQSAQPKGSTAQVLSFPQHRSAMRAGGRARLCSTFASARHSQDSVFWLKENAELLNILECTGADLQPAELAAYDTYYATVERRIVFFRPYYRFILSICLDLEDLGFVSAHKGAALAEWVQQQDLAGAELSDLQRAEARRLLARRGVELDMPGLDERLHDFLGRSDSFALPNKKIGYELTHIVFYLSEYGRRDPGLSRDALRSLHYLGLVSFLDQDADLLAEVAIALTYAGAGVPPIWRDWLAAQLAGFSVAQDGFDGQPDEYHTYFVCNWWQRVDGGAVFAQELPPGATRLTRPAAGGVLRSLSRTLYQGVPGAADWELARRYLATRLDPHEMEIMDLASQSTGVFGEFYERFSRGGSVAGPQAGCA